MHLINMSVKVEFIVIVDFLSIWKKMVDEDELTEEFWCSCLQTYPKIAYESLMVLIPFVTC